MGGVAALGVVATFAVALGLFFILLTPTGYGTRDIDYGQFVAFLADNQVVMYIWYLNIFMGGVFLVVLALVLYERLKARSPAIVQTATAFGFLWGALGIASGMISNTGMDIVVDLYGKDPAQAASVWVALDAVENGLVSEFEVPGGLWVLLLSLAALRTDGFPKALKYLGMVIGVAGILTVVPPLEVLQIVFGLGFIVWWIWLGIVMLRNTPSAAAEKQDASVMGHRTTT